AAQGEYQDRDQRENLHQHLLHDSHSSFSLKLLSSAGEQIFNLQSYFTAEQLPGLLQFRPRGGNFSSNEGFLAVFLAFFVNYRLRLRGSYFPWPPWPGRYVASMCHVFVTRRAHSCR